VLPDKESFKKIYMEALEKEWHMRVPYLTGHEIVSIYFGGGTPSLLGPERIHTIIEWIKRDIGFNPQKTEITLEANPENISRQLMHKYAQAGINRVSIGIQTLSDSLLKKLERQHGAQKAIEAVLNTADAGLSNITIDLMYDLPNQTLDIWTETLAQVRELPIKHLSLYNLTIEPHTTFFKHCEQLQKALPDPETSLQMYERAQNMLSECGLMQYEISAFAKEGYSSLHNTGYWTARPFLGLGPSAFSYWKGKRFRNIAHLNRYAEMLNESKFPLDFEEELDSQASLRELFTIRIRMKEGVHLADFERRHGRLDPETRSMIEKLQQQGYLEQDSNVVRLSKKGILFYDSVAVDLI
jgi:oxygen-independent coproporphyrinogen III oxidase